MTNGNQSEQGAFWIDPETLDLLQIDIEGYANPSNLAVRSTSNGARYERVLIGKRVVLLAHNSEFRLTDADGTVRRDASVFSNCREHTADSTVTFGSSATPQLPPPAMENSHVEPGLQLQLVLDRTLDANEAAFGDPIRARILKGVDSLPRGAHVYEVWASIQVNS